MFFQRRYKNGQQVHKNVLNIIREMQIKMTMTYYSHLLEWLSSKRQEISIGKDVEKRELFWTIGRKVNWCSHYGKQSEDSSKD